jgi:hypothetical protein
MTRLAPILLGAALLLACAGCGKTVPKRVPDVTGERLDVAENTLDALGLHYRTVGGGVFGIVLRGRWHVCEQIPKPPAVAATVVLTVERACAAPGVVGETLANARDELSRAGFLTRAHSLDGNAIVVESHWTVCRQSVSEGAGDGKAVDLYVAHDCWWYWP